MNRQTNSLKKAGGRVRSFQGMDPALSNQIVPRPPEVLKVNRSNARTHSKKQIRQIANSIKAFGFVGAIVIDENDKVLAGHGRLEASKFLELPLVPTLRLKVLTEAQKRAFVLADNKIAENAGWDRELLVQELGDLATLLEPLNWDLTLTGFEPAEIDALFADLGDTTPEPADNLIFLDKDAVSRPGDLWVADRHRILRHDSRSRAAIDRLMDDARARMVCADPPYNVRVADVQGRVGSNTRSLHSHPAR